jgi:hypothetical protein
MKPYVYILIIVLIGLGIGGYYFFNKSKNNAATGTLVTPVLAPTEAPADAITVTSSPNVNVDQTFSNSDYKIIFQYPGSWKNEDLGGEKNVTEPLTRENVFFIYDPIDSSKSDQKQAKATLKLLRFVLESNVSINSADDWYNYIKEKVDNFVGNKTLIDETGYNLISLDKVNDINGNYTVRENYTLKDNVKGSDYYIYAKDLYQFVFEAKEIYFDKYQTMLDQIVNSFNIK